MAKEETLAVGKAPFKLALFEAGTRLDPRKSFLALADDIMRVLLLCMEENAPPFGAKTQPHMLEIIQEQGIGLTASASG